MIKGAGDYDLRCGGAPMVPDGRAAPPSGALAAGQDGGTLLGKRYEHVERGLELLCVKSGRGSLTIDAEPLALLAAKKLPAAD